MKKIFLSIIVLILFILSIFIAIHEEKIEEIKEPKITVSTTLMKFGKYKDIKVDDIDYIEKIRYTEGGSDSRIIKGIGEIQSTYNYLSTRVVGSKTEMSCEDNTTIYRFHMKDDTDISIEIECGVLVMGKNRYILK